MRADLVSQEGTDQVREKGDVFLTYFSEEDIQYAIRILQFAPGLGAFGSIYDDAYVPRSRYNDGPESGQLSQGMCPGLDFFSIDNYADDPAAEVGGVKAAYEPLILKLRGPNTLEPKGQGLWVVPGIFWGMARYRLLQPAQPIIC